MCQLTELEYLDARQRKSAAMALSAADPCVAHVHREFAQRYAAELKVRGVMMPEGGLPRHAALH